MDKQASTLSRSSSGRFSVSCEVLVGVMDPYLMGVVGLRDNCCRWRALRRGSDIDKGQDYVRSSMQCLRFSRPIGVGVLEGESQGIISHGGSLCASRHARNC